MKRSIHNCMSCFLVIHNRIPQDSRLSLKFIQCPLGQNFVKIFLQVMKSVHQFQPDIRFQKFQPVNLHSGIVEAHFFIRFSRKIFVFHILCGLALIFFHVQSGHPFLRLCQRDPFLFGISGVESVDLFLDLVHHVTIDCPDMLTVIHLLGDIMLQLFLLPALPVFPTVHFHSPRTSSDQWPFPALLCVLSSPCLILPVRLPRKRPVPEVFLG